MKEILPNVFQITLSLAGFSPDSINVYLVRSAEGHLLVDTGWDTPVSVNSLTEQLSKANINFKDIKRVLITHGHIDHLGLIARFKASHNAQIYIHQNEMPIIRIRYTDRDNFIPMTDAFLLTHGTPKGELTPPEFQLPAAPKIIEPDVLLKGGEIIPCGEYSFQAINTPGHTPGHTSFYEPQKKFIISGDVLLPTIATNAAFHIQHNQNALKQYRQTLLTLQQLGIEMVLPAHEYVFTNPASRIEDLIKKQQRRSQEVMQALTDRQPHTAYEVARKLLWSPKTQDTRWSNLSGWDKRFALLLAVAHLEEQTADGKVSRFSDRGTIYYSIV